MDSVKITWFPEPEIYPTFEHFWNEYDKKVGDKDKLIKKFNRLSQKDKEAIMEYLPKYKLAQPNKQYRKNPETFLNNKSWNDEIIGVQSTEDTLFKQLSERYK